MWAFPPSTVHAISKDKDINSFLTKEASECSGKAFPLTKVIGCLFIRRAKAKTNPQVDTSNNSSNESESMEDSIEESLTESRQENSPTGGKSMGTHSQSDMRETLRDNNPINNDSKDNCLNPPESINSEASNTGQGGSLDSGVSSLSQNNTSKEEICDMETQQSSVTVDDSRPAFTEDVPISEAFGKGLPAIKTLPQRSEKMQNKSVNKNDDTSLRKSQFSGTANPIPTENASPEISGEVRTMVKSDPKDDEHSDNRVNQASADADVDSSVCKKNINNYSKDNCLNPPESIDLEASNNLLTLTGQTGSLDSGVSSLSQNNTSKEDICDMETQQSSVTVDDSRPAFTEDVPISEAFGKGLPAIKTLPQRSEKMQNKSVNKNDDTSLRKSQFSGTANPIPTENASPEISGEVRTMVKSDPKDDEHSDNRVNQASADADVNSSACKESSPKKRKSKTQQEEEQKSGNRNKKRRSEKIDKLKTYFKETNIDKGSTLKCINYREHNECRLLTVHDSIVYYDVNSKQDVLLITETPKEKSDTSKDNQFSHILGLPKLFESQLQLRMGILGNIIRAHVLFSGNKKPPYKLGYKKTYFLDVLDTFKSFVVEILIPVLAVYKQSQKETILKDFE
nr:PREDICTED: uncharacterized protein LOC107076614 isoform X2 [Lepisosteus oculatus]